jgi:aspartate kinase
MSGVRDLLIDGARAAAEGKDSLYRDVRAELLSRHLAVIESLLTRSPQRLGAAEQIEDRLHQVGRFYRSIAMLGECTPRALDAVTSFGSLLSASILAALLRERGLRAQALPAAELIVTDATFGAATPIMDLTRQRLKDQILPLLTRGILPVVPGAAAATQDGVPTSLGRGGGDLTAAVIGAALQAREVRIWSDADGILTADPNIVPSARTLSELSFEEASNLAYHGSEVLHPNTVRPLDEKKVPLWILNSFNPTHPGTRIVEHPRADREILPALISTTGLSLIAFGAQNGSWTLSFAARTLRTLADAGLQVVIFSQSFSGDHLDLVVRAQDQEHCLKLLAREFGDIGAGSLFTLAAKGRVATISVVAVPPWTGQGIAARSFAALGQHGTAILAAGCASSHAPGSTPGQDSVSFCIPEDQVADAVRCLHRKLGLEK